MNRKNSYRLAEYLIIEYDKVLFWKRHAGLAEEYSGKCFIVGDVLIIGDCLHREPGYLTLEFHEQLKKHQIWNKTRYYCLASNLFDVVTQRPLTVDFLERRLSSVNSSRVKPVIKLEPGRFRLGQYQITVASNCEIYWQAHRGLNRIAGGQCIIESNLLFIGSPQYEKEQQSKQEFFHKLLQLPQWD